MQQFGRNYKHTTKKEPVKLNPLQDISGSVKIQKSTSDSCVFVIPPVPEGEIINSNLLELT